MVGVGRRTPTDEAGLLCNELQVLLASMALGLTDRKDALVDLGRRGAIVRFQRRGVLRVLGDEGDRAGFQMLHQVLREGALSCLSLLEHAIDATNSADIGFPNFEELLDRRGILHGRA